MLNITEKDVGRYVKLASGSVGVVVNYYHRNRSDVRVFCKTGESDELEDISHVEEFLESSDAELVIAELKCIVHKFNNSFKQWQNRTQCRANFIWDYADQKGISINAVESMTIDSVDKIIYRRESMSDDEVEKALNKQGKTLGDLVNELQK